MKSYTREEALLEYAKWMEGDVHDLYVAKRSKPDGRLPHQRPHREVMGGYLFGIAKMSGRRGEKIVVQFIGSAMGGCMLATDVEKYDQLILVETPGC